MTKTKIRDDRFVIVNPETKEIMGFFGVLEFEELSKPKPPAAHPEIVDFSECFRFEEEIEDETFMARFQEELEQFIKN